MALSGLSIIDAEVVDVENNEPETALDKFEDLVDELKGVLQEPDDAVDTPEQFLEVVRSLTKRLHDDALSLTRADYDETYEFTEG